MNLIDRVPALAALSALALIFLWPVTVGDKILSQADMLYMYPPWTACRPADLPQASNGLLSDQSMHFYPDRLFARQQLRRGEMPLWNPFILMGTPFLADMVSAVLSPFSVFSYVGDLQRGFGWSALGRFALELAPLFPFYAPSLYRLHPVAEFIKPMSLVTIAVHHPSYGGAATRAPVPVMLGVVDDVDAPELRGGREPVRSVFVTGRSLAALLTDFRWWFHSYLAYSGAIQLPADVRRFFKQAPDVESLRDESLLRTPGFLAIDEQLFDLVERSPVALMRAAYEFFVVGDLGRGREPFIKLKFPATLGGAGAAATVNVQQLPVAVRLRFDADAAQASYFDQRSRLTSQLLPLQTPSASCWDLLRYFAESPFTELYAARGADAADRLFHFARRHT